MKGFAKYFTIVLLVIIFGLGVGILFSDTTGTKIAQYLQLCVFIVPPLMLIMLGVAGKSIAQVIKGEKTIEQAISEQPKEQG